jgi:hypothetical protein
MAVFVGLSVIAMLWAIWTGETAKLGAEATLMVAVVVAVIVQKRAAKEPSDEEERS